jgi:Zn finger protein HypA/HybF involved in hydrogenase expression
MNPRKIHRLCEAIKTRDFTIAEETFASIMQSKVENALVNERKNLQPFREAMEQGDPFKVQCMECGKKFNTKSMDPTCPKCGGADIDLAE